MSISKTVRERLNAWLDISTRLEWQNATEWAKNTHPGWLYLATQEQRPELQEMYRNKILEAYRKEREE